MTHASRSRSPALLRRRFANLRDRLFDARSLVQSEQTPYEVIYQQDIVRVRRYVPLPGMPATGIPVVLIAPLAVNMSIYDLFPDRSLVRTLLTQGLRVYLIDWGRPGPAQDHWRLATYFTDLMPTVLEAVRRDAGCRALSLHGWSFGGLFAYGYTAWSGDADIRNLVLVGAPCDYHDNGLLGQQYRQLSRMARRLGRYRALRPHASPPRFWRAPGWLNSALYKLTSPIASLRPHLELLGELDDRARVAAHATNSAFLDDMVAYPGGVIQDIVQYLWIDNVLAAGRLPMADSPTYQAAIHAEVLVIAGRGDPIVTPTCARAVLRWVAHDRVQLLEVAGGHMAILAGSRSPTDSWPAVAEWLGKRSAA